MTTPHASNSRTSKLAAMSVNIVCVASLLIATVVVAMVAVACSEEPKETPPVRKALPMDGFKDLAGVEARYAAAAGDVAAMVAQGSELVMTHRQGQRCANCHTMPGSNATLGPPLTGVGSRYSRVLGGDARARVWLHNKIWDPTKFPGLSTAMYGRSEMPVGHAYFTQDEIAAIVEYLMTLK